MANRWAAGFARDHRDLFRIQRRIMRHVTRIAQQQLQRVPAGRERDLSFGLAGAKMQMVEVGGNCLAEWRQRGIDDQVVMTRIGLVDAGRRNAHADQAEADHGLERDVIPIVRLNEVDLRIRS